MKIHYDTLTHDDIVNAANIAGVGIEREKYTGSQTHKGKVDIVLSGNSRYSGQWGTTDFKTATWDEWGIFLYHLYQADHDIIAGPYTSEYLFHVITCDRFKMIAGNETQVHNHHKWTYAAPCEFECKCGAEMLNYYHPRVERIALQDAETKVLRKLERKLERIVNKESANAR